MLQNPDSLHSKSVLENEEKSNTATSLNALFKLEEFYSLLINKECVGNYKQVLHLH
jgi:hypothetical protein